MQDTDSPFGVSIVAARWGSYRHTGLAYRRLVSTSATQSCCQAVSYLADRPPAGALLLKVPCCSCRLHGQSRQICTCVHRYGQKHDGYLQTRYTGI